MLNSPWDKSPANADDPAARTVVPMFPHRLAQAMRDDDAGYVRPAPIEPTTYERKLRETRHVVIPPVTWRSEIAEDFRDFVREVRRSPWSHALVAVLTVVAWTVLLLAPLLIGEWWS